MTTPSDWSGGEPNTGPPQVRPSMPSPPQAIYPPPPPAPPRSSGGIGSRVATYLISGVLITSILLNFYFFVFVFASMNAGLTETVYHEGTTDERIVIIPVEGTIHEETYRVVRQLLHALADDPPDAMILRIDSGGGYVGPCDRIWNALSRFKTDNPSMPLVASYGSYAASGGYYISAAAQKIVAEPTCTTGSIGVLAPVMTFDRLIDKIGITSETIVASGSPRKAVANDVFRPWTDEDRHKVKQLLDAAHEKFVEVVVSGFKQRNVQKEEAEIRAIANGDVYTAAEAMANQLIDLEGYLDDAIDQAKQLANMPSTADPQVTVMHPVASVSQMLGFSSRRSAIASELNGEQIYRWLSEVTTPRLEYRCHLLGP